MSSTNRSDFRTAHASDYYITPVNEIIKFLTFMSELNPDIFRGRLLDPCSGGDPSNPMSYPKALKKVFRNVWLDTIDIRQDSLAKIKKDYLTVECKNRYHTIITNPPFNDSVRIITKAIEDVKDGGYVVMLQRLNFMGSQQRKPFWEANVPRYIVVHHKRMSFTRGGGTDSIEYAHYIWHKGTNYSSSSLYII